MWPRALGDFAILCGTSVPELLRATEIAGITVDPAARPDEVYWALREDGHDGHGQVIAALTSGAAAALVAADWPDLASLPPEHRARCMVVPDTLAALRRAAGEMRRDFTFPVVAVGGSQGKTTTKEMIAALLGGPGRCATRTPETMNGHSGIPWTLLQREHRRDAPPDALVVEIGIDEPGTMEDHARLVAPDMVLLTALDAEHLAGLGDEQTAATEEFKLFEAAPQARRVYHTAAPFLRAALSTARPGDVIVSPEEHATQEGHLSSLAYRVRSESPKNLTVEIQWRPAGEETEKRLTIDLPVAGVHNGANLAVAVAAALALGRPPEALAGAIEGFVLPSMRCELHELTGGRWLIDDSYNANPASMAAALDLLSSPTWQDRPRLAILGDMLDLGARSDAHHEALVPRLVAVARDGVRLALFGEAMAKVQLALRAQGIEVIHEPAGSDPLALVGRLDLPEQALLLIKGSRGMRLERVVNRLLGRHRFTGDLAAFRGRFRTACVTGTNGKTTTTSLIAAIVEASGEIPCRVTTLGAWIGSRHLNEETSSDAFLETLRHAGEQGVRTLAVETTSLALSQGFARSWPPEVAVFTNLSHDHLDYHGSPERYLAAKAQLFMNLPPDGVAVLNLADPSSALLDEVTPPSVRRLGYAARPVDPACTGIPHTLLAERIEVSRNGTVLHLAPTELGRALGGPLSLRLIGGMHAENALAALLAGHALGFPAEALLAGISSFHGVEGRFEIIAQEPLVVVDYAHSPDALALTLDLARTLCAPEGRLLCVFGCGGERDPGKRGAMGKIASQRASTTVITNDNPRSEAPEAIADAIEAGAREAGGEVLRILDRAEAIHRAISLANRGDVVVIAGKGHEKTQEMGDQTLPFDDREIAREAIQQRERQEAPR